MKNQKEVFENVIEQVGDDLPKVRETAERLIKTKGACAGIGCEYCPADHAINDGQLCGVGSMWHQTPQDTNKEDMGFVRALKDFIAYVEC